MTGRGMCRFLTAAVFAVVVGLEGMAAAQSINDLYAEARAAFKARHYAKAAKLLQRILGADPRHYNAKTLLAHSLRRMGQCDKAIPYYNEILRVFPKRADLWENLGVCQFRLRRYEQAARTFQRVVSMEPRKRSGYRSWYLACKFRKDYQGALKALQAALKVFPKDAEFTSGMGETYSRLKQHRKAFAWHEKAVALAPRNAEYRYRYGIALRRVRLYKKAVEQYRKVIAIDPNFAPAYSELATLLAYMGNKKEAVAMYRRYLRFIKGKRPREAAWVEKRIQELSR